MPFVSIFAISRIVYDYKYHSIQLNNAMCVTNIVIKESERVKRKRKKIANTRHTASFLFIVNGLKININKIWVFVVCAAECRQKKKQRGNGNVLFGPLLESVSLVLHCAAPTDRWLSHWGVMAGMDMPNLDFVNFYLLAKMRRQEIRWRKRRRRRR